MCQNSVEYAKRSVKNMKKSAKKVLTHIQYPFLPSISSHRLSSPQKLSTSLEISKKAERRARFSTQIPRDEEKKSNIFYSHRKIMQRVDPSHQLKIALIKRCLKAPLHQQNRPFLAYKEIPKMLKDNFFRQERLPSFIEANKKSIIPREQQLLCHPNKIDKLTCSYRQKNLKKIKKLIVPDKNLAFSEEKEKDQLIPWQISDDEEDGIVGR